MAAHSVCLFNKFGYCRYGELCKHKHLKEVCDKLDCEQKEVCQKRHPKHCRYYRDFGRCKFAEYCFFRHKESFKLKHDQIESELEQLKRKVMMLEDKLESTDVVQFKSSETLRHEETVKLYQEKLDNTIENVNKSIQSQNEQVEEILNRDRESINVATGALDKKLSDYIIESFVRLNGLESKLEEVIDFVNVNLTNIEHNELPRKSKEGNKAANTNQKSNAIVCDICQEIFQTKRDLQRHSRCHHQDIT